MEGGSQVTPGAFIDWLIDVVEACDRVLAPHGSLCIELGDTYAGSGGAGGDYAEGGIRQGQPSFRQGSPTSQGHIPRQTEYGANMLSNSGGRGWPLAKSLSLIPELFRFTLVYGFNPLTGRQTERWRLRNVVRWVRPNPPVGALGDKFRPATSELMVFCKSAKRYFDLDAVRVPHARDYSEETPGGHTEFNRRLGVPFNRTIVADPAGAPPLDWWNIPPGGYEGAHYAVFPPELCIKPIKAMCPEKVCRVCGEPSRPIREHLGRERFRQAPTPEEFAVFLRDAMKRSGKSVDEVAEHLGVSPRMVGWYRGTPERTDLPSLERWRQLTEMLSFPRHLIEAMEVIPREYETQDYGMRDIPERLGAKIPNDAPPKVVQTGSTDCGHNDWRPGVVLDPFAGSGTTLAVATGHGRDAIGIDLDSRNFDLALDRVGPFILSKGEVAV